MYASFDPSLATIGLEFSLLEGMLEDKVTLSESFGFDDFLPLALGLVMIHNHFSGYSISLFLEFI